MEMLAVALTGLAGLVAFGVTCDLVERSRRGVFNDKMRMAYGLGRDAGGTAYWLAPDTAPKAPQFILEFDPWAQAYKRRAQTTTSALTNFAKGYYEGWMNEARADVLDQAKALLEPAA